MSTFILLNSGITLYFSSREGRLGTPIKILLSVCTKPSALAGALLEPFGKFT